MATNSTVFDDGQSRIVAELSDFSPSVIETNATTGPAPTVLAETVNTPRTNPVVDHQVNRFQLCVLVSQSAKRIKASAERMGESLPITSIVRAFLRSYRIAMQGGDGFMERSARPVDMRRLGERVLRNEIARLSRDRVKTTETRLAQARRLGDDTRIKAEEAALQRAISQRDRQEDDPP
jgi:hypothetical protein